MFTTIHLICIVDTGIRRLRNSLSARGGDLHLLIRISMTPGLRKTFGNRALSGMWMILPKGLIRMNLAVTNSGATGPGFSQDLHFKLVARTEMKRFCGWFEPLGIETIRGRVSEEISDVGIAGGRIPGSNVELRSGRLATGSQYQEARHSGEPGRPMGEASADTRGKSEGRSPKPERRPSSEIRRPKLEAAGDSDFGLRVSAFGLRI